jgi:hypothetical protein
MNCLDAQAHLSAFHDGEIVPEEALAAARAHCAQCAECTTFAEGLRYLDLLPVPPAPAGLADTVMEAIRPLAEERAILRLLEEERSAAESVGTEAPVPDVEPSTDVIEAPESDPDPPVFPVLLEPETNRVTWFVGPVRWATLGAATAFAATALVAFVVIGMGPKSGATTTASAPESDSASRAAATNPAQLGYDTPQTPPPAPTTAPDYVLFKEFVYAPGALLADSASATPTVGTLSTAFASGGAAAEIAVYRSPLTDGSIVVPGPDGLRLYAPVIRMLSSVRYQLTSGAAIDRFGVWPSLPARFPVPSNSAGTPTFVNAGTDALGITVFSATGRPVTEGFAIAPGTTTSDPAAGNPGWTWWAPAPATP